MVHVAIFAPTSKGTKGPGKLQVNPSTKPDISVSTGMIQAEGGTIKFTDDGTMAIFEAKLRSDKTNSSYYGNTTLHAYGAASARKIDLVNALKAPVHSYSVRPGGSQVMVSFGPLPAKLRLIEGKTGKEMGNFGENRRNHFRFNPCSKWLLMGGFGSLNGDTEVYDCSSGDVIGAGRLRDNVVADWFMDGRHVLLATTSPRLRVDNKLMVMRYNCEILLTENYERLTSAVPQPIPAKEAMTHYPPTPTTHTPMKNEVEGVKSYMTPAQRRRMEAEQSQRKTKGKGKGNSGGVIKAQGSKAIITGATKAPAIPEKKDDTPKIGFKMPF